MSDPIIKRIKAGIDHKEIKKVFGLSDSEFQAKLDEVSPPKPKTSNKKNK